MSPVQVSRWRRSLALAAPAHRLPDKEAREPRRLEEALKLNESLEKACRMEDELPRFREQPGKRSAATLGSAVRFPRRGAGVPGTK